MLDEEELAHPPREPALYYVWAWFCDLSDWRESGWGIGPLPHAEIEAWARLMGLVLSPTEVHCLRMLDRTFRQYEAEKRDPPKPSVMEGLKQMAADKAAGNG